MFRAGTVLLVVISVTSSPAFAARGCGPAMVQVTVLDQGGTALNGLTPGDFKVKIKNQSVSVKAVDSGVFPHNTLLLISHSGSMSQTVKPELAQKLADAVVATAPGTVMAGSFGVDVSALFDARSGQAATWNPQAAAENRNVLYDAVLAGMTSTRMHRGDAVVVITDAPDSGSKTSATDLQLRFYITGVRLFVIELPPATGSVALQSLSELAEFSGGGVLVPLRVDNTTKGLVLASGQIEDAVINLSRSYTQYNNIYQLETDQDGQDRPMPLKVEVDRRKLGTGRVVAPAMLAPCTAIGQ